jgi:hypothetical protein
MRILDFPADTQKEVIQRFIEEVNDAIDVCINGFVIRMSNVLIGFDPNVTMWLEPAKIIQARIPATMNRIRKEKGYKEGEEPFDFWLRVINATWDDMNDVEMEYNHREDWLQPLFDPILEDCVKGLTKMAMDIKTVKEKLEHLPEEGSYDRLARLKFTNDEKLYEILSIMMYPFAEHPKSEETKVTSLADDSLTTPLLSNSSSESIITSNELQPTLSNMGLRHRVRHI